MLLDKFKNDPPIIETLKYVHDYHESFLDECLDSGIRDKYSPDYIKIDDIFREHELNFILKERDKHNKDMKKFGN